MPPPRGQPHSVRAFPLPPAPAPHTLGVRLAWLQRAHWWAAFPDTASPTYTCQARRKRVPSKVQSSNCSPPGCPRATQGAEAPNQCQEECGRQERDAGSVSTGLHGRRDFADGAVVNMWRPGITGYLGGSVIITQEGAGGHGRTCGCGSRGQSDKGMSQGVQAPPDPGHGEATRSPRASGRSSGRSHLEDWSPSG